MEKVYPVTIGDVTRIEYGGQPVITTAQLAEFYDCDERNISDNFKRNEDKFISDKHFFKLEGNALKEFKDCSAESGLVGTRAAALYLWTKRGAARHAKMLSTERAWEVFEALEDIYFNGEIKRDMSGTHGTYISTFERGKELAKLAPHAKDPYVKQCIVAKAANLILGEEFLAIPEKRTQVQLTLFS